MRAAVVGTNWGAVHVAGLRAAGVEVVALVSRDPERCAAAARRLGVGQAVADPGGLAALGLDLVSVATPASTHVAVISACPDVAVLCEKPAVGLAPPSALPPGRTAPTWVNYAFPHLRVARRAAAAVDRIGTPERVEVVCRHDLDVPLGREQAFMELVPHPWSWVISMLGAPRCPATAATRPGDGPGTAMRTRCGDVPVDLVSRHTPGLAGIAHEVTLHGPAGSLRLTGTYRVGLDWRFEAPLLGVGGGAAPLPLGEPEVGPPDPWYLANERSIGAVVQVLRGRGQPTGLVTWEEALALDRTAQSAFGASPAG